MIISMGNQIFWIGRTVSRWRFHAGDLPNAIAPTHCDTFLALEKNRFLIVLFLFYFFLFYFFFIFGPGNRSDKCQSCRTRVQDNFTMHIQPIRLFVNIFSNRFLPDMRNAQDFLNHEISAAFEMTELESKILCFVYSWEKSNRCTWIAIRVWWEQTNVVTSGISSIAKASGFFYFRKTQTLTIFCLTRISEILDSTRQFCYITCNAFKWKLHGEISFLNNRSNSCDLKY